MGTINKDEIDMGLAQNQIAELPQISDGYIIGWQEAVKPKKNIFEDI